MKVCSKINCQGLVDILNQPVANIGPGGKVIYEDPVNRYAKCDSCGRVFTMDEYEYLKED